MSSPVEALAKGQATYLPGAEVSSVLSQVTMIPIIGPVAVGKSTCMDRVVADDEEFGRVQSFTTRPPREGEPLTEYRFRQHDDATLEEISEATKRGALVQYAVHPTTKHVYGSDSSDYKRPFMMLDTLASNVSTVRGLPFASVMEVTLVTPSVEWARRFTERNAPPKERLQRIREGIASLTWSLEQGDEMVWVCNPHGAEALSDVSKELRGLAKGTIKPNAKNRQVGEHLLATLKRLEVSEVAA